MKQQLQDRLSCALFDSPRLVRNLETQLRHRQAAAWRRCPCNIRGSSVYAHYRPDPCHHRVLQRARPDRRAAAQPAPALPHNPVYIIDGSAPDIAAQITIAAQYQHVQFIPFGYNIHHGPGMAWAINNLPLSGQVLFLDSDIEVLKRGFLESLPNSCSRRCMASARSPWSAPAACPIRPMASLTCTRPAC
jgi:hypothetical protein